MNADDFGWSERVNQAVLRAHRDGILTTASLMVAEDGFEQAVAMARETPTLGVGLHVATTFDRPLLSPDKIPGLVRPDGKFDSNPVRAGLRYAFSKSAAEQLGREMEAQFTRFAETGLPCDHVDGHQHFHMHPTVFRHFLALCDRFGMHRLRVPRESLRAHVRGGGDGLTATAIAAVILQLLCRVNLRMLREKRTLGGKSIFLCDHVYGDYQSSNMHAGYLIQLLDRLDGTVCEVYSHPGSEYARRLPIAEQSEAVQDVELQALIDPLVREKARNCGWRLATYAEAEAASAE